MTKFMCYLFVASINLCNRNTEPYHTGFRVLERAIIGLCMVRMLHCDIDYHVAA